MTFAQPNFVVQNSFFNTTTIDDTTPFEAPILSYFKRSCEMRNHLRTFENF